MQYNTTVTLRDADAEMLALMLDEQHETARAELEAAAVADDYDSIILWAVRIRTIKSVQQALEARQLEAATNVRVNSLNLSVEEALVMRKFLTFQFVDGTLEEMEAEGHMSVWKWSFEMDARSVLRCEFSEARAVIDSLVAKGLLDMDDADDNSDEHTVTVTAAGLAVVRSLTD